MELHLRIHRVTWPIRPTPCLHIAPQIHFQVPLEMCPLSNVSTRLVDGIESQPIRRYIDRGVLVTVNTDDPIMSGNSFVAEYQALVEVHQFTRADIQAIVLDGIQASWLARDRKRKLMNNFSAQPE